MLENRFAIATAAATFLLLLVGSVVNPTGSSLACPEAWFICQGSMFPQMSGGVLYEHGHRMVAMLVGLLQIGLTVVLWLRRPALAWLGVGALAMVIVQGSLGAATVHYQLPTAISTGHLLLAMLYFATLLHLCWRTRRPEPAAAAGIDSWTAPADVQPLRRLIGFTALAVYAQIGLGALVRHTGGALACIDLPLCAGSVWPAGAPLPLQLHMAHRIAGVVVALVVVASAIAVYRRAAGHRLVRVMAVAAVVLVAGQVALGPLAIATFRAIPVVAAHLGLAALLWGVWVALYLSARGICPAPVGAGGRVAPAALEEAFS